MVNKACEIRWIATALVTAWAALITSTSEAAIRYILDFDGTIVHDQGPDSAWVTPWVLVRISELRNMIQRSPSDPVKVFYTDASGKKIEEEVIHPPYLPVSYDEFKRLRPLLGKGEAQLALINPYDPFLLTPDAHLGERPRAILPGYYRIEPAISFQYFQTGADNDSENEILKNAKSAIERQEQSKGERIWKGYGFGLLQAAFSHESRYSSFTLSTARYHDPDHMKSVFKEWMKMGELPKVPDRELDRLMSEHVHFLGNSETLRFGRTLVDKKAGVVMANASQLLMEPAPLHLERGAAPWDTTIAPTHTLIVAEDDPTHMAKIDKRLRALSSENFYRYKIKFVVFHSGPEGEMRAAGYPTRWTVFFDGFTRPASDDEIALWTRPGPLPTKVNCESLLEAK